MINKLFNLALSYINKKEEGVRFRTAVALGIYTVAFGGAYVLAVWAFVKVVVHFGLYDYIPLWAFDYPILFMIPNCLIALVFYLIVDKAVSKYEVEEEGDLNEK